MRFSKLQSYILTACYYSKSKSAPKEEFYGFYKKEYFLKNKKIAQDIIHKSLENLTEKNLIAAYGRRTAEKWFIDKVKLTPRGRRAAREIISGKQRKLPIK